MDAPELGRFLRARREATEPRAVGLPDAGPRRTPGLRREELAVLAGIGVSWLTRLEQGGARRVSTEVLDRVADALALTPVERTHLFTLAGERAPAGPTTATDPSPELRRLVDRFGPDPAYVLDESWHLVAWNAAEAALFPVLVGAGDRPHLIALMLDHAPLRAFMTDWADEIERLAKQFRLHLARHPTEQGRAIAAELRTRHPDFARAWNVGDVLALETKQRTFAHPVHGRLVFDHHRLALTDHPGWLLVTYVPTAGTDTDTRFARVLGRSD